MSYALLPALDSAFEDAKERMRPGPADGTQGGETLGIALLQLAHQMEQLVGKLTPRRAERRRRPGSSDLRRIQVVASAEPLALDLR